jgi:UrcA family protein
MRKLLFAPLLLAAAPATAGEVETLSVTVETSDLDLATPGGQRRLGYRVDAAVNRACPATGRSLLAIQDMLDCRRHARAKAEPQVRFAIAQASLRKAQLAANAAKPAA